MTLLPPPYSLEYNDLFWSRLDDHERAYPRPESWADRAWRYRRQQGNFCERCEHRTWRLGPFTIRAKLQVHHVRGRGVHCPEGAEHDECLELLCVRCHARITAAQFRLANTRGYARGRKIVNGPGYSQCVFEATRARWPASTFVRRAVRRMLLDRPERREG